MHDESSDDVGSEMEFADKMGLPFFPSIRGFKASRLYTDQFPIEFSRRHCVLACIPINPKEHVPFFVSDQAGWRQIDSVRRLLGVIVRTHVSTRREIQQAIDRTYEVSSKSSHELVKNVDSDQTQLELRVSQDLLESAGGSAPVIQLVNTILLDAAKLRASDIHLQPAAHNLVVRMRVDGILFESTTCPKNIQEEIASRIKVLGGMDIAEKRMPQDGRASVRVGSREIDLRISSLPTCHGERIVIRLLEKTGHLLTLEEIGMSRDTLKGFKSVVGVEHGLVLVTGPTGSGKSTTLYAALQELNTIAANVLTIEDPIEYEVVGVSQTQINQKKGLTFASGLRTVLRQDPDVIMVGEIRDHETAAMAMQSALTGHLVFSTLHTNDAASAITRLLDLGVEPYLVSSALVGVLAQRLVRCVCSECARAVEVPRESLSQLHSSTHFGPLMAKVGHGCEHCRMTGYSGRVGLFELFEITSEVQATINKRCSASELRDVAMKNGMRLLHHDGMDKVVKGTTSVEEVIRVTMRLH